MWRWLRPGGGPHRDPRRAFAEYWNLHSAPGDRWEDDPQVAVLTVRAETVVRA